jgi:MFS family permease
VSVRSGLAREIVGISILWLALGMLSDGMNTIVMPARLADLVPESGRATTVGLVVSLGIVAAMLVQPFVGALSDRYRQRVGRLPFIGAGILVTCGALALFAFVRSLEAVVLAFVAVQLAASSVQAAQQGLIPDRIVAPRRGLAAGAKNLMDLTGALLGFALLGGLVADGYGAVTITLGAALVVAFVLSALLVREGPPQPPTSSTRRGFVFAIGSRFLFLLATYAIGRFFLLFVAERLGVSAEQAAASAGGLLAAITLATVVAALPGGWAADRFGRRTLVRAGALLGAAGALALIPATSEVAILGAGLLLALASAAFVSANWALVVDLAPPAGSARALGYANFGTAGAAAAAGLFGPLIDAVERTSAGAGYPALFISAAALFLASGLLKSPPEIVANGSS